MKTRIQELEHQCWEHQPSWTGLDKWVFNSKKFAQLIVQECIHICQSVPLVGPYKEVQVATLLDAAQALKEHFGVQS